jgi:hypothetical protein
MSHAYADGVNIFPMFTAFTNEKDFSTLMKLTPPSWQTKLLHQLVFPFAMIEFAFRLLMTPTPYNTCLRPLNPKGKGREAIFSDVFSLTAFKKKCKEKKTSLNNALFSIAGQVVYEYGKA